MCSIFNYLYQLKLSTNTNTKNMSKEKLNNNEDSFRSKIERLELHVEARI